MRCLPVLRQFSPEPGGHELASVTPLLSRPPELEPQSFAELLRRSEKAWVVRLRADYGLKLKVGSAERRWWHGGGTCYATLLRARFYTHPTLPSTARQVLPSFDDLFVRVARHVYEAVRSASLRFQAALVTGGVDEDAMRCEPAPAPGGGQWGGQGRCRGVEQRFCAGQRALQAQQGLAMRSARMSPPPLTRPGARRCPGRMFRTQTGPTTCSSPGARPTAPTAAAMRM